MKALLVTLTPVLLALTTAFLCWNSPATTATGEAGVILELPQRIGGLQGHSQEPSAEEIKILPTDTTFAKMTYATADATPAERDIAHVSIVLAGAESRSIHRPEICLPGQGWSLDGSEVVDVDVGDGRQLKVRDLTISGMFNGADGKPIRRRAHYVYWFTGTDITTASHVERIWHSAWDAMVHGKTHRWAYTSVMAVVTEDLEPTASGERRRTDEETRRLISYIIQEAAPQFQKDLLSR
jgi:hypothetical protein